MKVKAYVLYPRADVTNNGLIDQADI